MFSQIRRGRLLETKTRLITALSDDNDFRFFIFSRQFPFREAVSKVAIRPVPEFVLAIRRLHPPRMLCKFSRNIYDTKGSDKPAYGIREAEIVAENHYHGAPTIRSQKGNPQKSSDDLAR